MYRIEYQSRKEFIMVDFIDNNTVCSIANQKRNFLHNDVIDEDGNIVFPSPYREKNFKIAGVLQFNDSRFYGRYKNKLLYSCIPHDKNLPIFYIPYKPKYDFLKHKDNLYVTFELKEFETKPIGQLTEVFGSVRNLSSYFLYELHAKNLWFQPKRLSLSEEDIIRRIKSCSQQIVEDRTETHDVFTIDPKGCKDYDDAFSFKNNIISIYISNVPVILEVLGITLELTNQVSSIYLPDTTRNMLPKQLAESLCSLVADGTKKFVFYMDIFPDETIQFGTCSIRISKNFAYEDDSLLQYDSYQKLFGYAKEKSARPIVDSHHLVEFFMIFMNHECSVTLKNGIYRSTVINTSNFSLYDYFGEYSLEKSFHGALELDCYGHFSSPIRRIVDIINLILLQTQLGLFHFRNDSIKWCEGWKDKMQYLNDSCRAIRKMEQNSFWLHEFEILKGHGYNYIANQPAEVVHKEKIDINISKYTVFLKEKRKVMTIKTFLHHFKVGDVLNCYLYYFENEDGIKKKIRLQISEL